MLDLRQSTCTSEINALYSILDELSLICGGRDNSLTISHCKGTSMVVTRRSPSAGKGSNKLSPGWC